MKYEDKKDYLVEIALTDDTKDTFNLKGSAVAQLREKIYQQGYTREDKVNKGKVCYWISPFVIAIVTITEKNQTLTDNKE
jgi:hypothetical protein